MRRRTDRPMLPPPRGAGAPPDGVRGLRGFGGLVPAAAGVMSGSVRVVVPALELHAEGAVVPLVILSDVPGVLRWNPGDGLEVVDDAGTAYGAVPVAVHSGLGQMLCSVWLTSPVPPEARRLRLRLSGVRRMSVPRGGSGVERSLRGGPWEVDLPLVPERTWTPPPPEPAAGLPTGTVAGAPTRALDSFESLVPVGQARVRPEAALGLWAVERYGDRAVLTLCVLHSGTPMPWAGEVDVWDDRGGTYVCAPMQEVARDGWTEVGVEIRPGIDPAAGALAIRVTGAAPAGDLAGPVVVGVRVEG